MVCDYVYCIKNNARDLYKVKYKKKYLFLHYKSVIKLFHTKGPLTSNNEILNDWTVDLFMAVINCLCPMC